MLLEAALEAAQDLDGLSHRRLDDIDLLETPSQRVSFSKMPRTPEYVVEPIQRSSPIGQHGLDQVGRVHHAARSRTRADDGVNLVNETESRRAVS